MYHRIFSPQPVWLPRVKWNIGSGLAALICTLLFSQAGYAGKKTFQFTSESSIAPLAKAESPIVVIGFVGGFVSHDERHHPEVQLIQNLRHEYREDAYIGLFENNKVGQAYRRILKQLGANESGQLSYVEKRRARILLFGHSWGASAVVALSKRLNRAGIPVMLTIQLDSVAKPFQNDRIIPANVLQAINFYQSRGLIHGQTKIVSADPSRTAILGNFQLEYKEEPEECREFSWYARVFTRSHIEVECDPKMWEEVNALLHSQLPEPAHAEKSISTQNGDQHHGVGSGRDHKNPESSAAPLR